MDTTSEVSTQRSRVLTQLFTAAPDLRTADRGAVRDYAAALIDAGVALVPIAKGAKNATLTGWSTNPITDINRFDDVYRDGMNLAIHTGASKIAVIDADTPDEVAAFLSWATTHNYGKKVDTTPTVTSPGTRNDDGVVGHTGGGHWYVDVASEPDFDVNDVKVSEGQSSFAIMTGSRYVLLPGSNRSDAADATRPLYTLTGRVYDSRDMPAVERHLQQVTSTAAPRTRREPVTTDRGGEDPATARDLLIADGWKLTGRVDSCGCPVLTRPIYDAPAGNPKSATLHSDGVCADSVNGVVLTVWSDHVPNLPGQARYSIVDYVLATEYGHDFAVGRDQLDSDPDFIRDRDAVLDRFGIARQIAALVGMTADGRVVKIDGDDVVDVDTGVVVDTAVSIYDRARAVNIGDDAALWSARPWLEEVLKAAFVKGVDPYAVLLTVLCEVALYVPEKVVVGGKRNVSLNLIVMLVGEPADGKGTAADLGRQLVELDDANDFRDTKPETYTNFSGQGLGHVLAPKRDDGDDDNPPMTRAAAPGRFVITEASSLVKLTKQTGATHIGTMCAFFMGEELGATNSDRARRFSTPAHSYRGVIELQGQPSQVMPLFEGEAADTGLSARLLNARVLIPEDVDLYRLNALESGDLVDLDEYEPVVKVKRSSWENLPATTSGLQVFPTDRGVEADINRAEHAAKYGHGDKSTAHEALRRRKVAALLAIASGESEVTREWWNLADYVMKVSRAVTRDLHTSATKARTDAKVAAKVAELDAADEAAAVHAGQSAKKVIDWLTEHTTAGEWVAASTVKKSNRRWNGDDGRAGFDRTLADLEEEGLIEVADAAGRAKGRRVRLVDSAAG